MRPRAAVLPSRWLLEPSEETEPVTATVDHADIRGLGTTLLVSVGAAVLGAVGDGDGVLVDIETDVESFARMFHG